MTTNEMNKIMMTDELSNGLVSLLALSYLSEDEQKKLYHIIAHMHLKRKIAMFLGIQMI